MNTQKRARQWMLGGLVLLAPVLDLIAWRLIRLMR